MSDDGSGLRLVRPARPVLVDDRLSPPPPVPPLAPPGSDHLLTVAIEDYFQLAAFNRVIQQGHWARFERRVEHGVRNTLDLLAHHQVRATFFVLGWVADQFPELVREVCDQGHEIASKGYFHRPIRWLTRGEFSEDLARADEAIRGATGRPVLGYRMADSWLGSSDHWILNLLAERGYRYDSSVAPLGISGRSDPVHPHRCATEHGELWEFPISSVRWLGIPVPIGGGNYMRQLPHWLVSRAIDRRATASPPLVLYFHTWELDPSLPRISGAPWYQRVRTYRNLDRMAARLSHYLARHRFGSIADHLGATLPSVRLVGRPASETSGRGAGPGLPTRGATPITIVVPCYNEEVVLPFLANTLRGVTERLHPEYECRLLFVDDGSTDGTWAGLEQTFGGWTGATLVRHDRNRGLAAGIRTGLERATTDTVCTIDCDCSYDPALLIRMLPMLGPGIDLVTASPYHPQGQVRNVPPWRLALSRGASLIYQRILGSPVSTYTSCVRVYRRSAVLALPHRYHGFLGVAETMGRLAIGGRGIAECPATLEARLLGRSKMKVIRTIGGHLRLLSELAILRVWHRLGPRPRAVRQ